MAVRPLAFGVRFRHQSRTLMVRQNSSDSRRYVVEDSGSQRDTRRRDHPTLGSALRDLARTWRGRLN